MKKHSIIQKATSVTCFAFNEVACIRLYFIIFTFLTLFFFLLANLIIAYAVSPITTEKINLFVRYNFDTENLKVIEWHLTSGALNNVYGNYTAILYNNNNPIAQVFFNIPSTGFGDIKLGNKISAGSSINLNIVDSLIEVPYDDRTTRIEFYNPKKRLVGSLVLKTPEPALKKNRNPILLSGFILIALGIAIQFYLKHNTQK